MSLSFRPSSYLVHTSAGLVSPAILAIWTNLRSTWSCSQRVRTSKCRTFPTPRRMAIPPALESVFTHTLLRRPGKSCSKLMNQLPGVNALQNNWVDNLIFVSTETPDVEHGVGSLQLRVISVSMWTTSTWLEKWFPDEPTSFLHHVYLGCMQTE